MDKNTISGLLIIALIVIGYGYLTRPSPEQIALYKQKQDSIALMTADSLKNATPAETISKPVLGSVATTVQSLPADSGVSTDSIALLEKYKKFGVFAQASEGEAKFAELENNFLRIKISSKGGRVYSAELKNYKRFDSLPLLLFNGDTNIFRLQFPLIDNNIINTDELFFARENSVVQTTNNGNAVSMRLYAGDKSKYIEYVYSLEPDSYLLNFSVNLVGLKDLIPANSTYLSVDWSQHLPKVEKSMENERIVSTCYFKYTDEEVDHLSETSDEKKTLPTKVKWIAFKQQFFSSVLIPEQEFEKPISVECATNQNSSLYVKNMSANFTLAYSHKQSENYKMRFYFGPNHVQTLKNLNLGLEKLIPLGWGIFGWVNRYLVIPTFNFLDDFHLGYGLIILILAILIKVVLLPLTYKAYISQAKMRVLKPEMDEATAKYPNDQMKAQQETMAIYRKAGVNPLGGCIPLLLQFPILIAMFRFFPSSIELRQQSFLWANDLSTYDSVYDFGFSVPFYGDHVSLFTILMTISTILYTMMNNQMMSGGNSAMQKQMKWMGYIMPFIFMGVLNNYSAGLSYYYFLANITSFGQQYLFKYFVDEKAIHARIQENKKKPVKKSGFQQRLEEMAKQRGYKLPNKK